MSQRDRKRERQPAKWLRGESGSRREPSALPHQVIVRALRGWLAAKKPVWRFTGLLFGGLGLFYVGYALLSASGSLEAGKNLVAWVCGAVLDVLGYGASVDGTVVTGSGFAFRVVRECMGLEPVGFLLAAALATPVALRRRFLFALVGGALLVMLNLVRLVSLAVVDVHFPRATEAMHWNAWPAVTIVVVVVLWVAWARRVQAPAAADRSGG